VCPGFPSAGKRPGKYALDIDPALGTVEALRRDVLFQNPEVHPTRRVIGDDRSGRFDDESTTDSLTLHICAHVKIVE